MEQHRTNCGTPSSGSRIRSLALIMGFVIGGLTVGNAAIFAKIDGIDGESKTEDRAGWMDVIGLGTRIFLEDDETDGRTWVTPKAGTFIFRKNIDKASPYLLEALLKGTELPELQVEQTSAGRIIGCYRMRGVHLTHHQLHTVADDTQPEEELGFGYEVIEWHYFRDDGGMGQTHFGSTWDFALGEGGILGQHRDQAPMIGPLAPLEMKPGQTTEVTVQFLDPAGAPENLVFTALPSDNGLVKVLSVAGRGLTRTLVLQAGELLNGTDNLLLSLSDGERSSTRQLPVLVTGDRTAYEAYVEGFLSEQAKIDPGVTDLLRDPDHDQLSNFMEFYLGTNPGKFTRDNEAFTFARVETNAGVEIQLQYFRRIDTSGLLERFEGSSNLQDWLILGGETTPPLKTTALGDAQNGYLPMEARVFLPADDKDSKDKNYYMKLSLEGPLQRSR